MEMKMENDNKKRGYRTRRFNVLNYFTNEVVAENVLLSEYCSENDYDRANLLKTLGSDLTKDSSRDNRHHHKSVFLVEVGVDGYEHDDEHDDEHEVQVDEEG